MKEGATFFTGKMPSFIDRMMRFDDYINDESIKALRAKAYKDVKGVVLL